MNREFENSGRKMPYRVPPQSLEALHERILSHTSRRPASRPRTVRRYCLTAAAAAAAVRQYLRTVRGRDAGRRDVWLSMRSCSASRLCGGTR